MLSLTENLSKLESIKITGFTDNSNFVKRDYAFISFSKNPKEALKYSKEAIDKGAKIVISQVNLHEHLKDKITLDRIKNVRIECNIIKSENILLY